MTRPDLHQVSLAYDSAGRLASVTIPRGTITLTYNVSTGNLQSVTAPDGDLIELAYDGILPSGISWQGDIQGSVGFTYDNDLRLGSVSVNTENPLTYTYDSDSLLTQAGGLALAYDEQTGLLANTTLGGTIDGRAYNDFGEQVFYVASYNSSASYETRFSRDLLGLHHPRRRPSRG